MVDKRQKIIGEDAPLFEHIWKTGKGFYITVSVLGALVLWGLYAYVTQYLNGLTVTGLSRQIFWGVYITNFVFFIGISHAGTFISAVLRVLKAEWRRPISRASELTTVFILLFGVGSVLIDLGRPDRMLYAIRYANFQSPLLWDVCSITMYLTVSSICLYLALIPDVALLRDLGGKREWFYRILSFGWTGTERQHRRLEKAINFMSILVIPVMITVHTVVSFVFAMTIQPLWHSAIFGPYFVVGAIFSGVASVIVVMVVLRKVYHLEGYIKAVHFNNIGIFLMAMTLLWFYFTFAENITIVYGNEPVHMAIFWSKLTGRFAPLFWLHFVLCFVIPLPILALRRFRTIRGTVIASTLTLGVSAQTSTVSEAQSQAASAMDKVMSALTGAGIDKKDIQTQNYSIQQVTRWDDKNQQQVVLGYLVSNMVVAKIRALDKVGNIIDTAVTAGGDLIRVNGISFSVEKPEQYYVQVRELAMNDAKAKAEQIAKLSGVTLGKPTYVSENSYVPPTAYPTAMYKSDAAGGVAPTTPITPGETDVNLSVQVTYAIQ